jgi:hypothetical protein
VADDVQFKVVRGRLVLTFAACWEEIGFVVNIRLRRCVTSLSDNPNIDEYRGRA